MLLSSISCAPFGKPAAVRRDAYIHTFGMRRLHSEANGSSEKGRLALLVDFGGNASRVLGPASGTTCYHNAVEMHRLLELPSSMKTWSPREGFWRSLAQKQE